MPSKEFKKICVMGLGYIGLPTASLLATKGFDVFGVDVREQIVNTINDGQIHIVEPDLDILVKSAVQSGQLKAGLEPRPADVFIIAVPTPFRDGKKPDLSYIRQATQAIADYLEPGNLVILESTSPVGTTDEIVAAQLRDAGHRVGEDIFVAHCPERVLPGRILIELVENDRVVGGINDASTEAAVAFYESFVRGDVIGTTAKTAELVKLTENSYRDVNIAFANEISMIADVEGINTWEVIELANRHPRVNILNPGPGVGGHCIAVDPWFIVDRSPQLSRLIRTAREVNDYKPEWVIERVRKQAARFKDPVIGCLGLAFKADVDDLRESPAYDIVKQIQQEQLGKVLVCEPNLKECADFDLHELQRVIDWSDIIVLLVDHRQFKKVRVRDMHEKILIDTRGMIR